MLANTFTFRSFCIFDARETEWLQLSGNFFGAAALCKLVFACQKLSTLPVSNFTSGRKCDVPFKLFDKVM